MINWIGKWYKKQEILLNNTNYVNDAKVLAMLEGLKKALKISITQVPPGIFICLYNLGLVCNAGYMPESSNQKFIAISNNLQKAGLKQVKNCKLMNFEPCKNWWKQIGLSRGKTICKNSTITRAWQTQFLLSAEQKPKKTKNNDCLLKWQERNCFRAV